MFYLIHYIKNIISTYDQWNIVHFWKLGIQNPVSILYLKYISVRTSNISRANSHVWQVTTIVDSAHLVCQI